MCALSDAGGVGGLVLNILVKLRSGGIQNAGEERRPGGQ